MLFYILAYWGIISNVTTMLFILLFHIFMFIYIHTYVYIYFNNNLSSTYTYIYFNNNLSSNFSYCLYIYVKRLRAILLIQVLYK